MKAENVATFLGRKLSCNYEYEMGNSFSTDIEGTRIKHMMEPVWIEMDDKRNVILRMDTTANDASPFEHHREVEPRDRACSRKIAPLEKSIHGLADLHELMAAANVRCLKFISALLDSSADTETPRQAAQPGTENGRNYRGFDFFSADDDLILAGMVRGEFTISDLRNKDPVPPRALPTPQTHQARWSNL